MARLDDITLIQRFVAGGDALESNQNLRIQPANERLQLLSRRGVVLAIADPTALPPTIAIRSATEFSEILNKVLLAYHYVPISEAADAHFFNYQHYSVPGGYTINYGPTHDLWKQWWMRRNQFLRTRLQMDLLVLARGQWYPIRDIILAQSTLYISTLLGETAHMGEDKMVWLEKDPVTATTKILPSPLADAPSPPSTPAPTAPAPTAAVPGASSRPPQSSPQTAQCSTVAVSRALQSVVRCAEGKLYIRTAIGEVIVEGHQLKCYPNRNGAQPSQTAANRVGIRPSP